MKVVVFQGDVKRHPLPNNITGITKANPGVVSSVGHGLSVGDRVYFSGLAEMTELNGTTQRADVIDDADNFSILDTSGYGTAESTGGACGWKENRSRQGHTPITSFGSKELRI